LCDDTAETEYGLLQILSTDTAIAMPSFRPTNFSWVIDGLLSGCAFPYHGGHFQYLVEAGVRHLVTLTEFTPQLHLLPTGELILVSFK